MGNRFAKTAFTETVKMLQEKNNSRHAYARMEVGEDYNYLITPREAEFIEARDSFYMASVGETGWPYIQHRGGPKGFLESCRRKHPGLCRLQRQQAVCFDR